MDSVVVNVDQYLGCGITADQQSESLAALDPTIY